MQMNQNTKITSARVGRVLVGITLLLSAFIKAGDLDAFVSLLQQYGFPGMIWMAPVITVAEAAAGVCLLLGIYPRQVSLLTAGMIIAFSLAFLHAYLAEGVTDCGCFGKVKMLQLPPWATFTRNAVLLLLLFVAWRFSNGTEPAGRGRYVAAGGVLLLASFLAGYTFSPGKGRGKVHPLYQRAVSETALPQLVHTSPDSTYMVVIFSYRCDGCWNHFENVKRYHDPTIADRLLVLAVGQDSTGTFRDYFRPDFEIREVDEGTVSSLTQVAPTVLYVAGDTIRHVIQGIIPTRYVFERDYIGTIKN
jgi:uncharacterized membrane protein YphA (DoxX/SURF4 family)